MIVAAYWALLFFAQRSMLFPMPPVAGAPPRPAYAEQVWLSTSFGRVEAWYLPPIGSHKGPAPLLVFTHGNGELIDYWPVEFDEQHAEPPAAGRIEFFGPVIDQLSVAVREHQQRRGTA